MYYEQGRVPIVFVLNGRPMAHWNALSKGFPMVPRSVFVGGYFSVCGLLSLGLVRVASAVGLWLDVL